MSEAEAATVEVPAARTRKPKGLLKRKYQSRKIAAVIEDPPEVLPTPAPKEGGNVYGWPIKDGFARMMIFSDHNDGNKITYVPVKLGDHPVVQLAKQKMHVLPMGLVNIILDTVQEFPVDDLEDEMKPKRYFEKKSRWAHSEPIPATWQEYVAYRKEQEKLPHPNNLKKN
jgi:hypothetical protein